MCRLFVGSDSRNWTPRTRSLRIDGVVSSIRMEEFFWAVLEEIAVRDGMSTAQLITRLYLEAIDEGHDLGNFTSFLRVCCGRYLSLIADRELEREGAERLADQPVEALLAREAERDEARRSRTASRASTAKTLN